MKGCRYYKQVTPRGLEAPDGSRLKAAQRLLARISLETLLLVGFIVLGSFGCASHQATFDRSQNPTHSAPSIIDIKNRPVDPFAPSSHTASVFIFVGVDCPISNRYAPELERLYRHYRPAGVAFWLVYPDPDTTTADIAKHLRDFRLSIPALRDPRHELVRRAGVSVTPETAVFLPDETEIYHGRVDDRFVDFGKERPAPLHRDLDEVLGKVVRGEPSPRRETVAFGCYISPLN